ncbi:MAG: Smr/MutS family protein [Steroidobacteraceae bacterium]|jgi:DNA-nicking Smr family endonuclease
MTKRRDADPKPSADALDFRAAMQGVRPLAKGTAELPAAARKPRKVRPHAPAASLNLDAEMPLVDASVSAEAHLSHRRAGVRDQMLRKLRRGLVPVEGELDLHGYSQARAREMLAEFIAASRAEQRRCVRIIHGKGTRSGTRGAVLKSAVNEWLRRHFDVMAFTSAKGIDGGTGAVYVLLRA